LPGAGVARTGPTGPVDPERRGGAGPGTAQELSTEVVHDRLRQAILRGELDPRAPISQVQLAATLGVSRTPLREALRMLQREGLISSEPNRRVRVAELSMTDLEQLYACRVLVEALAVRVTVLRQEPGDAAGLRAALSEMERLTDVPEVRDVDAWEAAHRRYHEILRGRAGERIRRLGRDLSDHSERYRRVYMAERQAWSIAAREHAAILEAFASKDGSAASVLLVRHLARTALTLIASVDPEHEPTTVREALRLVGGSP
jgi:DNA-binding GntR family transcriptional regulator